MAAQLFGLLWKVIVLGIDASDWTKPVDLVGQTYDGKAPKGESDVCLVTLTGAQNNGVQSCIVNLICDRTIQGFYNLNNCKTGMDYPLSDPSIGDITISFQETDVHDRPFPGDAYIRSAQYKEEGDSNAGWGDCIRISRFDGGFEDKNCQKEGVMVLACDEGFASFEGGAIPSQWDGISWNYYWAFPWQGHVPNKLKCSNGPVIDDRDLDLTVEAEQKRDETAAGSKPIVRSIDGVPWKKRNVAGRVEY